MWIVSHRILILSAAEGFWLLWLSVGRLRRVTGRLETVLDAVPEGRYLAGFYMSVSGPRVSTQFVWTYMDVEP